MDQSCECCRGRAERFSQNCVRFYKDFQLLQNTEFGNFLGREVRTLCEERDRITVTYLSEARKSGQPRKMPVGDSVQKPARERIFGGAAFASFARFVLEHLARFPTLTFKTQK